MHTDICISLSLCSIWDVLVKLCLALSSLGRSSRISTRSLHRHCKVRMQKLRKAGGNEEIEYSLAVCSSSSKEPKGSSAAMPSMRSAPAPQSGPHSEFSAEQDPVIDVVVYNIL